MSYQVLARKWRPKSFSEMAGQEHVLQALINALDNDRLHHAYLFTGTRGVGKTTIGRILSKCLNCEKGVSSVPCGECSSCTEIDAGRFIDLIEVDAASRTGVDDMRDLLDNVQYAPSRGRFKIYLIDEIHMLSKSSFAALLKTLEEPPPHVKFLFATTDPQKLPITVLSRCLQFNLKNLSAERITEHLKYVLGEEKVPFEEAGLWSLGRAADGSMRDALSLTDQAVGHGGGSITESDVISMLGTIERHFVVDICIAMASQNGEKLLSSVGQMAEHSPDYDAALGDVLSIWHQVAILQTVPEALDRGISHFDELANLAETVSREDVQLFYQICLLGRKDLPLAPEQRAGFEMVMLRAMAFRPTENGRPVPLKSPPPEVEQPAKKPEPAPTADVSHHSAGIAYKDPNESLDADATVEENKLKETLEALDIDLLNEEPAVEITNDDKVELLADNVTELDKSISADSQVCEGVSKVSLNEFLPSHWIEVRRQLKIGASLGEIASHCLFTARVDDVLQFIIDDQENSLFDASHQESLGVALSDYFDHPLTVSINSGVAKDETPRAANIRENNERKAAAVERLNADPSVMQFKQLFNGGLDEQSVESID
ncbi:DNA polymerase III subunit gamma/tau [Porticoccaceae bacterium]|nr:DNA polymerase III subunit gamma/tau [Porticoccaceae bacterium]MDA8878866.1 DNA polymerase III subunit gamma/tau [Porticoccaceae bacterium]MDA9583844.1 DNA polymerase III subunit gamma/tau [Porticoccaceae bacterium]MDB2395725.1 DNA polymerase III subunit gamma/tau [Porticoccaceae bacterium]MDB2558943.1 DNA polymerase III subunit gamma/tau [Porticoccaceae bacterium]